MPSISIMPIIFIIYSLAFFLLHSSSIFSIPASKFNLRKENCEKRETYITCSQNSYFKNFMFSESPKGFLFIEKLKFHTPIKKANIFKTKDYFKQTIYSFIPTGSSKEKVYPFTRVRFFKDNILSSDMYILKKDGNLYQIKKIYWYNPNGNLKIKENFTLLSNGTFYKKTVSHYNLRGVLYQKDVFIYKMFSNILLRHENKLFKP